jgi:hypothetical protein
MRSETPAPISLPPETVAAIAFAPMYYCAAIIGALAERGALDPMKVAAWADVFAKGQGKDLPEAVRAALADQLGQFAELIRSMATVPKGAGRG